MNLLKRKKIQLPTNPVYPVRIFKDIGNSPAANEFRQAYEELTYRSHQAHLHPPKLRLSLRQAELMQQKLEDDFMKTPEQVELAKKVAERERQERLRIQAQEAQQEAETLRYTQQVMRAEAKPEKKKLTRKPVKK